MKDQERTEKIDKILTDFSQIRSIKAIKDRKKTDLTIGMIDDADGKLKTERASITEVFAKFYEELYRSRLDRSSTTPQEADKVKVEIAQFTEEELVTGLTSIEDRESQGRQRRRCRDMESRWRKTKKCIARAHELCAWCRSSNANRMI